MSLTRQFDQSEGRQFVQSAGRQRNRAGGAESVITVEAVQNFYGYLPYTTATALETTRYLQFRRVVQIDYFDDHRQLIITSTLDRYTGAVLLYDETDSAIGMRVHFENGVETRNPLNNPSDNPCFDMADWGSIPRQSHEVSASQIVDTYWDGTNVIGTDTFTLTEEWTLEGVFGLATAALSAVENPGDYHLRDFFNPAFVDFHYGFERVAGTTGTHINHVILTMTAGGVAFSGSGPNFPQSQRLFTWSNSDAFQYAEVRLKKGRYRTPSGLNEIIDPWLGNFTDPASQHWGGEITPSGTRYGRRTTAPGVYLFSVPAVGVYERHSYFGLRLPP